jgi:hypothetical protein
MLAFGVLILFCKNINAEVSEVSIATDRYYYSESISNDTACERALEKAKISALEKVVGSTLTSFSGENCTDIKNKTECTFFEDTIAYMGEGFIKNFTFKEFRNQKDEDVGSNYCEVEIAANVSKSVGKVDTNFNLNAKIEPNNTFIDGSMNFSIKGVITKLSYINIFLWFPYENNKQYLCASSYYKQYDNPVEKIKFPPMGKKVLLRFPEFLNKKSVAEYVLMIATKDKVSVPCLLDNKTKHKMIEREKLLNIINKIDRDKWTKQMLVYKIIK